MESIRWVCIQGKYKHQKQDWICEWTLSFTRKGSIALLTAEGTSRWDEIKKIGWRCVKVKLSITEL